MKESSIVDLIHAVDADSNLKVNTTTINFFKVLLEYYAQNDINIDFCNTFINDKTKYNFIKNIDLNIFEEINLYVKLFDLVEFIMYMFLNLKLHSQFPKEFTDKHLGILLYIMCMHNFNKDLRLSFKEVLEINDSLFNLLEKWDRIIKDNFTKTTNKMWSPNLQYNNTILHKNTGVLNMMNVYYNMQK